VVLPRAANVSQRAGLAVDRVLDVRELVRGRVAGHDARAGEEVVRRVHLERADDGLHEVDDVLVLLVAGAVARDVERGRAGRVLRELVLPEVAVRLALRDPVLLHCARASAGVARAAREDAL
jgi:hypothetical protein